MRTHEVDVYVFALVYALYCRSETITLLLMNEYLCIFTAEFPHASAEFSANLFPAFIPFSQLLFVRHLSFPAYCVCARSVFFLIFIAQFFGTLCKFNVLNVWLTQPLVFIFKLR